MSEREHSVATQVRDRPESSISTPRLCLVAIGDGVAVNFPLPEAGEVTIGRAKEADVRIDHPSISRRHAILRLGPTMSIEDLGSANGTRLRDKGLQKGERADLALGEVVDLGATLVSVQSLPASAPARRLWTHGFFEAHLEEECLRATHGGRSFGLIAIQAPKQSTEIIEPAINRALRPLDILGLYAPGEYEAILVGASPDEARNVAAKVLRELTSQGVDASVGLAVFPADGRSPDALSALARDAGRRAGGSERASEARIGSVVVEGGAMRELYRLVERVATGQISVLILGETGVGKEVVAETMHKLSKRAAKAFLKLNCAALSETLLESELFGHEKGSFTGAVGTKQGLLETAHEGTVFLDEVGELPMTLQVKLLRVLEERAVLRVGGLKPRTIDVRFVAATNRDLEAEVAAGRFRQDLYFRLNGITLVVPPLRQRVNEIEPLARAFIARSWRDLGREGPEPRLSREALELMRGYAWPGNIRELRNVIERAVLLSSGSTLTADHLPADRMRGAFSVAVDKSGPVNVMGLAPAYAYASEPVIGLVTGPPPTGSFSAPTPPSTPIPPRVALAPPILSRAIAPPVPPAGPMNDGPTRDDLPPQTIKEEFEVLERQRILDALARCAGNQTKAAKVLGISRATLVNRLNTYGVPRPRKPPK